MGGSKVQVGCNSIFLKFFLVERGTLKEELGEGLIGDVLLPHFFGCGEKLLDL